MSEPAAAASPRRVEVVDLGRLDYASSLERQERAIESVRAGGVETLLLAEHPPVYTIGRGGNEANLLGAPQRLGVPSFRIGRGGDATFHGPGQLVAYPILSLDREGRDLHRYLRRLEEVVIRTLAGFGLAAQRIEKKTGVWIGRRKIASIGVGVRRWMTCHGLALNVDPDLDYFRAIVACGIDGVEVTSMARELGPRVSLAEVRARLVREFAEVFAVSVDVPARGAAPRRGRRYAARISEADPGVSGERKPPWLRARMPAGGAYFKTRGILADLRLTTVCQEALCPNIGECWAHSTATFLLMGESCTRSCGFCAVKHGATEQLDPREPERVASAAARLGLKHVVVTSVNRDDLPDGGAGHFAATARAIKRHAVDCAVELLIPDFQGDERALRTVVDSPVDVLDHNTETVPRLYPTVRPGSRYARSLELLARAKRMRPELLVKSGVMAGLGETDEELLAVFGDLRAAGCDILTVGQYLRPSPEHLPVRRFVRPEEFAALRDRALALGFHHVEAGPLVRSSYHAWRHVERDER
ncbi:MAG: lipoyl synthase [Deltaproteobacteria bacterium]|nr:lipoyl synthase [Deltaproteobacteria bacterium]